MACPQAVLWIVKVGGKHFRTIWRKPDDECVVQLIDQRLHVWVTETRPRNQGPLSLMCVFYLAWSLFASASSRRCSTRRLAA